MRSILNTSVPTQRPVLSTAASEPLIPISRDSLYPRCRPAFICSFCHQTHRTPAHVVGESARLTCEGCYRALIDLAVCWKCGELVYRGDACVSLGWCFWHRVCFGCLFCGGKTSLQEAWGGDVWKDDWWEETGGSRGAAVELNEIPLCQYCLLKIAGDGADEDEIVRLALDSARKGDVELIRARYQKNKQATLGSHAVMPEAQDEPYDRPASPKEVAVKVNTTYPDHIEKDRATNMTKEDGKNTDNMSLSTIYVSMSDPLNGPSFKPSPTKSIPLQMQPFARHVSLDDGIPPRKQSSCQKHAVSSPVTQSASVVSPTAYNIYRATGTDKLPSCSSQDTLKRTSLTSSCVTDTPMPQIRRQRYSYVSNEPNLRPSLHSQSWRHMQRRHVSFQGFSADQEPRPPTRMDTPPGPVIPEGSTCAPEYETHVPLSIDGHDPLGTDVSTTRTTKNKVTQVAHEQPPVPPTISKTKHSVSDDRRQSQSRIPLPASDQSSKLLDRSRPSCQLKSLRS
ncbi:hypothetical protein MCOR25_003416 [Pyricularia grisea]|nr:hypothetical protein MCOR25_003416 [Pyricularia grisea]